MAKEKDTAGEEGKPKNSMKLIIIILAQVILLVVVAGGVMIYMKKSAPAPAAGAAAAHAKVEEPPGEIFALEPFVVNIHQGAEIRYLRVKVELETVAAEKGAGGGGGGEHGGGGKKGALDAKQTQLRDAIITILSTKALAEVETLEGKNKLREEILKMCQEKVTSPKVTKVYFTDFVIQ